MAWPGFSRADLAAIAAGGVAGASLRWLITRPPQTDTGWLASEPNSSVTVVFVEFELPVNTLIVNLFGCLLLGALTLLLARSVAFPRRVLIAAATGFCGSLTTFSTFAVEVAELLRGFPVGPRQTVTYPVDYETAFGTAAAYLALSIVGGSFTFWLGRTIARRFVPPSRAPISRGGR